MVNNENIVSSSRHQTPTCMKLDMMSMGTGKIIVLLFSAEIPFRVWRYRSCKRKVYNI